VRFETPRSRATSAAVRPAPICFNAPNQSASLCIPLDMTLYGQSSGCTGSSLTGLACMLSSGLGKRHIGATTKFLVGQSIRRFSLAWPYVSSAASHVVAVRYACYISARLALLLSFLGHGATVLSTCARGAQAKRRNVLLFFSDLLLVILARST
jgi:hypothetical protein